MSRVYNFSAGPAVLPESVLKSAAEEMLDYNGTGMSVMEMSHRSKAYQEIIETAEADLRELMHIPDNYKVLFLLATVCYDSDESYEKQGCRLHCDRSVGKEGISGGLKIRNSK